MSVLICSYAHIGVHKPAGSSHLLTVGGRPLEFSNALSNLDVAERACLSIYVYSVLPQLGGSKWYYTSGCDTDAYVSDFICQNQPGL